MLYTVLWKDSQEVCYEAFVLLMQLHYMRNYMQSTQCFTVMLSTNILCGCLDKLNERMHLRVGLFLQWLPLLLFCLEAI